MMMPKSHLSRWMPGYFTITMGLTDEQREEAKGPHTSSPLVGQYRRKVLQKVREIRRRREIEVLLWGDYTVTSSELRLMNSILTECGRRGRSVTDNLNQHAAQRLDNWFAQWRRSTN